MFQTRHRRRLPVVQIEALEGRQLLTKSVDIQLFESTGDLAPADVYSGSLGPGTVTIHLLKSGPGPQQGQKGGVGGTIAPPPISLLLGVRKHYDHAIVTVWDSSPKVKVPVEKAVLHNLNLEQTAVVPLNKGGVARGVEVTYTFASETVENLKPVGGKSSRGKSA